MGDFKLKKHKVQEARFCENIEIEKNNDIEVGVQGSILIPKNFELNKNIIVQLKFRFGKEEEKKRRGCFYIWKQFQFLNR